MALEAASALILDLLFGETDGNFLLVGDTLSNGQIVHLCGAEHAGLANLQLGQDDLFAHGDAGLGAKIIIDALFECVSDLDMVTNKSLLAVSSSSYAIHLVLPLFEKIDKEKRLAFWKKKIYGANLKSLPTIAQVINMLELGYGRLIANGEEKDYKKVISLNELLVLEKEFSKKTKNLLDKYSIFDFADYRMIMYLMENFEPGYIEGYMNLELQSDINVLKYLKSTIYTWTGNGVRYEISNEYERHLTKERIVEAIRKECDTKEIFDLPQDNQRLCAAFYLKQKGVVDDEGQVVQKDADDLLEKWKEK